VIGLSSVVGRPVSLVRRAHVALPGSCPSAGSDATTTPQSSGGYTVAQIASAYGISAEWASGDTGQGQTIGLYELAPYSPGDIATFFSCYGITPSVTGVNVDGGSGDAVSEEATFDIEEAAAMAPGAQIVVYTGPNNSTGPNDILLQIADDDLATVVSTSWGDCETDPANDPTAEQPIFEQMAAEGQTMVASSGDSGSSDCSGITNNSPAVDDPASQPYVTSVGGLTVTDTSPLAETVWNDGVHSGGGAGGGGESLVWSKPTWQNGPGVTASESMRMVPDLSTMADPSTSFIDFFTNNFSGACGHCANDWGAIGGTSTGAPLLAAMTSIGANACGVARLGFLNPTLYAMARRGVGFDDVTTGSNDLYGVGVYPAGVGYDMASGLGSPDPSTFFPGLCPIALDASHSSLVASTTSATVPGPVTLTLSARDATGAPIAGAVIKFSASASSGIVEFDSDRSSSTGTGSAAYSVTTDDTGAASVTLTESAAASASVTASSGGATLTTQVTFTELMTSPPGRASVARAVATVGGFRVTARAPLSAGSSAITAYQYSIGSGRWVRFSAATLVAKASHLARHTTYHVRVRALNAFGAGPASAAVAVRTL
ncbi:MAG: hypothetical protein ACRDV0_06520, partial [Acidimicrobiales bacterium]